jgi:hypothetical protein
MIEDSLLNMVANYGFPIIAFLLVYIDLRKLVLTQVQATDMLREAILGCPYNSKKVLQKTI